MNTASTGTGPGRGAGLRYGLRLVATAIAYLAPPTAGVVLAGAGLVWTGVGLMALYLLLQLALLLVFSTLPLPARPGTLSRMDFAAMTWLPHVAVTRLTEKRLQGRSRAQLTGRVLLVTALLFGASGAVTATVLASAGVGHPAFWSSCALSLLAAFLSLAYAGRELGAARGRLARGTDIG